MNHPQVIVTVEQYATETVSVVGEVARPGAYPITTPRTVLDVLSFAGGITNVADRNILIQRHGSKDEAVSYFVSNDPKQAVATQIMVNPGDSVIVPKAGIVYILGDVNRPGGFAMSNNQDHMTLLQALSLAGGLQHSARQGHARLIRQTEGTAHEEQLNLGEIQKGKAPESDFVSGGHSLRAVQLGQESDNDGRAGHRCFGGIGGRLRSTVTMFCYTWRPGKPGRTGQGFRQGIHNKDSQQGGQIVRAAIEKGHTGNGYRSIHCGYE